MTRTKRRLVERRRAWGRGPHILAFVPRPEPVIATEIPSVVFRFPDGERAEYVVADRLEVGETAAPIAIVRGDGSRLELATERPDALGKPALRLHDAMVN